MSQDELERLNVKEIDNLRLKAFKTNSEEDREAYFKATSIYFQDHSYRSLILADLERIIFDMLLYKDEDSLRKAKRYLKQNRPDMYDIIGEMQ